MRFQVRGRTLRPIVREIEQADVNAATELSIHTRAGVRPVSQVAANHFVGANGTSGTPMGGMRIRGGYFAPQIKSSKFV